MIVILSGWAGQIFYGPSCTPKLSIIIKLLLFCVIYEATVWVKSPRSYMLDTEMVMMNL